jgi:hypothetical protein
MGSVRRAILQNNFANGSGCGS